MFKAILKSLITQDFLIKVVQTIILSALSIIVGYLISVAVAIFAKKLDDEEKKEAEQYLNPA